MGGTNPAEIKRMIAKAVTVYSHPTLHVKMGIAGQFELVGSSNASANGLSVEGAESTRGLRS
jgi:hypothetical protein